MIASVVIVAQIFVKAFSGVSGTVVVLQVNILVLDRPPEAFHENVVIGPTAMVHADLRSRLQKQSRVFRAGKMTALVAVHDFRDGLLQSAPASVQYKADFQGIAHAPVQNVTGMPVEDGDKIKPVRADGDMRNVDRPDLIGTRNVQSAQ